MVLALDLMFKTPEKEKEVSKLIIIIVGGGTSFSFLKSEVSLFSLSSLFSLLSSLSLCVCVDFRRTVQLYQFY